MDNRSYSVDPELMHYDKGQRAKKHKYIAIKNGRYIYPDNIYRGVKKAYKQASGSAKDLYKSGLGLKTKTAKKIGSVKETILKETIVPETIQKETVLKEKVVQDKADRKPYNWDAYNTREASRKKRYVIEAKAAKAKAERLAKQRAAGAQRRKSNIGGDLSQTHFVNEYLDYTKSHIASTLAANGYDINSREIKKIIDDGAREVLQAEYIRRQIDRRKFEKEYDEVDKRIKAQKVDKKYDEAGEYIKSNKAYKKMQKKANKKKKANRR